MEISRSHAPWSRSSLPVTPVSIPMMRRLGVSIAQYGPGWTARCPAAPRYSARAAARARSSTGPDLRHSRRATAPNGPRHGGGAQSASRSQKTRRNPRSPSYQSWLPGTA